MEAIFHAAIATFFYHHHHQFYYFSITSTTVRLFSYHAGRHEVMRQEPFDPCSLKRISTREIYISYTITNVLNCSLAQSSCNNSPCMAPWT
jgi:hypothetical protein